jgi:hypothetical protein
MPEIPNLKLQISNNFQFPKSKTKKFWSFENWDLGFVWDLEIGIWDFKSIFAVYRAGIIEGMELKREMA